MRRIVFILLVVYWGLDRNCDADWMKFASSDYYLNTQMVTQLVDFFPLKVTPKIVSTLYARIECSLACERNESCLAFNFYETETFYTCELLPDNFCSNRTRKALVAKNGSSIWEKIPGGAKVSCVEQKFGRGSIPCEFLQPGCSGTWPNCNNCVQSCSACFARGCGTKHYYTTLWPEQNLPVFGKCYDSRTYLFINTLDTNTGDVQEYYRMRFSDMYRIYKLQIYSTFRFYFGTTDNTYYTGFYANWALNENGTLLGNLTFVTPDWGISTDVLNVTGRPVDKIPFVELLDDRYGCGSFWLVDDSNSTYCPGGQTSVLGAVIKDSKGHVLSSGIKVVNTSRSKVFSWATVEFGH